MEETLSNIAPLLGVILTAIGAFFAYRRSEVTRERKVQEDGKAALLATAAGAVQSQQNGRLYIEEFQRVIQALDRLTESNHLIAKTYTEASERWRLVVNEAERHRRAMEELVAIADRRKP